MEIFSANESSNDATSSATTPLARSSDWQFVGEPLRVLFLCTSNGARSQMAEALLRHLSQKQVEVFSAGSHPAEQIHPEAVRAIARLGADMSQHVPKHLEQFRGQAFDRIIVLGDPDLETCPSFPDVDQVITWRTPDPLVTKGSEQERSRAFDLLAIELNTRIRLLLTLLERERRSDT